MKKQPEPNYQSNDDVQTPPPLARALAAHFQPYGWILEPCCGDGHFVKAMVELPRTERLKTVFYTDIKIGKDFLDPQGAHYHYDWIITNPPFSKAKAFLEKSFAVADNVVFLITLNHALGLKSRWNLCDQYNFGVREIVLLDTPPKTTGWPQAGFQLGAVHWQREYSGDMKVTDLRGEVNYEEAV